MLEKLKKAEIVSLDFETGFEKNEETNLIQMDKIVLFSVAVRVGSKVYADAFGYERFKEVWGIIKKKRIVFHNAKFDLKVIKRQGIDINKIRYEDTLIMAYLLDENRRKGLKELRVSVLGLERRDSYDEVDKDDKKAFIKYAKADAEDTLKLYENFAPQIEDEGLATVYELEKQVVLPVIEIEDNGAKVDTRLAAKQEQELTLKISEIKMEIEKIIKYKINFNSPKQVSDLFFRVLKYTPLAEWETKTGYSTGSGVLEYIALDRHKENRFAAKIAGMMSKHRKFQKLLSGFINPILTRNMAGIIYPNFNQVLTVSGRFSSSGPNLQNIPTGEKAYEVDDPFATVRALFDCFEDEYFFSADYSQIELRMMAELSKDKYMCEAYMHGADIHDVTAKLLKISRKEAKVVNFGIGYGMTSPRLASFTGLSVKRAQEIIDSYWGNYKGLNKFARGLEKTAGDVGFIKSISGRKRRFTTYGPSEMRQTLNFVIQGSCADLMKMAMVRAYNLMDRKKSATEMTVHDELCGRINKDYAEEGMEIIKYSMESVLETYIPIIVEPKIGYRWSELK